MKSKKKTLQSFISREFFKAALLPLLIIEVALLALYFFMNSFVLDNSVETLRDDRLSHLMGITKSQSRIIGDRLDSVLGLSLILKSETERFFKFPEAFPVPSPLPEFGFSADGVFYKQKNNGGCSLFYSSRTAIGIAEKDKAFRSESLDPIYKALAGADENIVAVYLNTHDSMNRYYPFFEDVHEWLVPDMDIPKYNFYYLADEANNPEKRSVWTEAYLDPMKKGWMMSCIVPIFNGDFLEGVAGIDITISSFIDRLLSLKLPWGAHAFLVDAKGTIMAMPPDVERIFGISELSEFTYKDKVKQDTHKPESFNLLESVLASIQKPLADVMQKDSGEIEFFLDGHRYMLCQHTVMATGWKFMVLADRATILRPISELEKDASRAGYAAIGFMGLFYVLFFLYLIRNTRRMSGRIAQTLGGLSNAIQRLGTGVYETKITPSPVMELDTLSTNFETMAMDLKRLHKDLTVQIEKANSAKITARQAESRLKEQHVQLEKTVAERTAELQKANHQLQTDISKRKRIEAELDQERQQLLSIFDSIDEPIYIATIDTHELLYCNEALKRGNPNPINGKCYEVLQNRNAPCPFCTNDIIIGAKSGKTHIWEHQNLANNRWFRCIDKAIQWPDGRMVRYEMAIDITETKKATQEKEQLAARLQRAEKMKALGTLAGGVAHDLNNILGGIVGYPDLLLLDMAKDNPLRKPVETIRDSGLRATAIVQDLLTLARRGVSVMESVNLNEVIDAYLDSPEKHQLMLDHPMVRIQTDFSNSLLNCMGSAVHLSKVVMNLVSNAAESMPDGGDIVISTANRYVDRPIKGYDEVQEGEYTVLRVADCGTGISKEDMERIFEPFYTKKKMGRSGTGLGMAVIWGTIKDHNGYLELESTLGRGTAVEIYLPSTREKKAGGRHLSNLEAIRGNHEMILVVDDVEVQRKIADDMLESLGYSTHTVSSGEEAVSYLENHSVDLVLLDMIMEPNIDGLETYRRIIKKHPGQKAIIVSGFSETDAIREAQRLGAGVYVKKPYTIYEIGQVLKDAFEGR